MNGGDRRQRSTALVTGVAALALLCHACGLFGTRTPEDPTQPSLSVLPATDPPSLIANLQNSISKMSVPTYVQCLADPLSSPRPFTFIPSSDGAPFASVFQNWGIPEEQAYFTSLTTHVTSTSQANLILTQTSQSLSSDSAEIDYDYVLTFEHTLTGVPTRVSGHLKFALQRNTSNIWTIYRWTDLKDNATKDLTWTLLKAKASN